MSPYLCQNLLYFRGSKSKARPYLKKLLFSTVYIDYKKKLGLKGKQMLCIPEKEDARRWAEENLESDADKELFMSIASYVVGNMLRPTPVGAQRVGRIARKQYLEIVRSQPKGNENPQHVLEYFCKWMGEIYGQEFEADVRRYCILEESAQN